jgi:hypothetical protein
MRGTVIQLLGAALVVASCLVLATDLYAGHWRHRGGYYGGGCGGYSYGGPVYGGYGYGGRSYGGGYATYPYGPVYGGYSYGQTWGGYGGAYFAPMYSSPAPFAGAAVESGGLPPAGTPSALGDADRSARADLRGQSLPPAGITPLRTTDPPAVPPAPAGNLGTPNADNPPPGTPNPDAAGIPGTPDASLRAAPPVTPGTR